MSWTVKVERGARSLTLFVDAPDPVSAMRVARARAARRYGTSIDSWLVNTCLPDPDALRWTA